MPKKETLSEQELQHSITEFNCLHSSATVEAMIRDVNKGRFKKGKKLTILQSFELNKAQKEKQNAE